MKQAAAKADTTPFQKFQALARHILTTPKSEVVKAGPKRKPTKARAKKPK